MLNIRNNETVFYIKEGKIYNILGVLNGEEVKALQNDTVHLLEEDSISKISSLLEKMKDYVED